MKKEMNELQNKLKERYNKLVRDNNFRMEGVKGYERVNLAENYYRMDEIEKILGLMESIEES